MGHYDESYAEDDRKQHNYTQGRISLLEERLKKDILERGLERVLAEIILKEYYP